MTMQPDAGLASSDAMFAIIHLLGTFIADLFKSPRRLEVENLFLRHDPRLATMNQELAFCDPPSS
jgi:hypothetical protein